MKILGFVSFLILFGFNEAIKKDIPDYVCNLMVNGTLIKAPTPGCTDEYYVCIDGVSIEAKCPRNYVFNKDRQMCVPKADYTACSSFSACGTQAKGFAQDPFSCHGYYSCTTGGKGTLGYCQDEMSFDKEKCWKDSEICNINMCLMVPNYVYFGADGEDCSGWQFCKGDYDLEVGSCGTDMVFDRDDGFCDHKLSGNCRPSSIPSDIKVGDYCDYDNFKIDSKSCTGYFYCHKNKVFRADCLEGKFFTGDSCVSRLNYHCVRGDPCVGLGQSRYNYWQWVNDPEDCKKYFHCNGDKANGSSNYCPESAPYFDQERQVCSKTKPSYKACHEPEED